MDQRGEQMEGQVHTDCRNIKDLIGAAMHAPLTTEQEKCIAEHTAECSACADSFAAISHVNTILKKHRPSDDAAPERFSADLHLRLAALNMERKPSSSFFLKIFAKPVHLVSSLALIVVVAGAFFMLQQTYAPEPVMISQSEVDARDPLTINIKYNATRAVKDMRVTVALDEGVAFYSDNPAVRDLKNYVWRGDLKQGVNEIPFVVEVRKTGKWVITTTADFEEYSHIHKVELNAQQERVTVTYFELKKQRHL